MTRMSDLERRLMAAVDKYERNRAFTAPELAGMRLQMLREDILDALADWEDAAAAVTTDMTGIEDGGGDEEDGADRGRA